MSRLFGACPPEGFEWQLGKTAATIRFVGEAESKLSTLDESLRFKLMNHVRKLKTGEEKFTKFTTIDEFLTGS